MTRGIYSSTISNFSSRALNFWSGHRTYRKAMKEREEGRHLVHLVSLTIYIELEGHMMAQNDTLDEADNLHPKKISG